MMCLLLTHGIRSGIAVTLVSVLLVGCASYVEQAGAIRNRAQLMELVIGMTQEQVESQMGEPSKTETFSRDGYDYVVLYYLVRGGAYDDSYHFGGDGFEQLIPVVLREGRLIGWGEQLLTEIKNGAQRKDAGSGVRSRPQPSPLRRHGGPGACQCPPNEVIERYWRMGGTP